MGARVTLREGDLFSPLPPGVRFDAIVSNPPYIRTGELATLQGEVQREPRLALDGGRDGLDLVRRIAREGRPGSSLAGALQWRSAKKRETP